jgi:hypothetical protein
MKKPEWPGIATVVGILLILTLVAVGSRDDFHLKDWQPLMASVIALGGAAVVYRGAKLAYTAAMAKVDFDREIHQRSEKRKALGLCLRLDFALNVLRHQGEALRDNIPAGSFNFTKDKKIDPTSFVVKEPDALTEAWHNLDIFPPSIAGRLSGIRGILYDLTQAKDAFGDAVLELDLKISPELMIVRENADTLSKVAIAARNDLSNFIRSINS